LLAALNPGTKAKGSRINFQHLDLIASVLGRFNPQDSALTPVCPSGPGTAHPGWLALHPAPESFQSAFISEDSPAQRPVQAGAQKANSYQ
jgi:hypothetical protein